MWCELFSDFFPWHRCTKSQKYTHGYRNISRTHFHGWCGRFCGYQGLYSGRGSLKNHYNAVTMRPIFCTMLETLYVGLCNGQDIKSGNFLSCRSFICLTIIPVFLHWKIWWDVSYWLNFDSRSREMLITILLSLLYITWRRRNL